MNVDGDRGFTPRAERLATWIDTSAVIGMQRLPARIAEVSASGCLLAIEPRPAVGTELRIELPRVGRRRARVVHQLLEFCGCAFLEALDDDEVALRVPNRLLGEAKYPPESFTAPLLDNG